MKQYEINCFEVTESYDRDTTHIAYVSSEDLANLLIGNSPYRRAYPYTKVITIFDTIDEIEENKLETLRKSGLAKLSTSEKIALGLINSKF